jgi:rubrerythrin
MDAGHATRRQALGRGLIAGGALAAGPAAVLAAAGRAEAKAGEAALLERAIELEQEASVAYESLAEGDLLDEEVAKAAVLFADQQREHVGALSAALEDLDGKAPAMPRPAQIEGLEEASSQADGLTLAIDLENALIRVYGEIVASPAGPAILKTVVEIAGNAAQHLVVLRQQLGDPPLPEAFETGTVTG